MYFNVCNVFKKTETLKKLKYKHFVSNFKFIRSLI